METVLITGAGGLIGSEASRFYCEKGYRVLGIDNDMRGQLFGKEASTKSTIKKLSKIYKNFKNESIDIRDNDSISRIFEKNSDSIKLIIHTAAQPSHDWAASDPLTDFGINAYGTMILLEATRKYCNDAVFIFTSTNKVYGDKPNSLPIVELEKRWDIDEKHQYYQNGIDESMSIDYSKHSVFGASKISSDIMVQEYGRYFNIKTGVFRGGCLTGPDHNGVELHGFLSYMMKCAVVGKEYSILGYKGKQVRDNIHSFDIVNAFYHFFMKPKKGEVYNIGGSRYSNCSILEAIELCNEITGKKMKTRYIDHNRSGDHIWWISDISKFKNHFPSWKLTKNVEEILVEIFEENKDKWSKK